MTVTRSAPATRTRLPASFHAWLAAATIAALGDGVLFFAIGWTAAGLGGHVAGLLLTLVVLPRTALMLVAGAIGDRFGIRKTVIACDAAMLVALTLYLVAAGAVPAVLSLAALALVIGTVSAFRLPASGALPRLFATDDALPRAMSLASGLVQVARLVGPPLGGVVVAWGMTGAVTVNLITFAVILVVLVAVTPPYDQPPAIGHGSAWRRIRDGLRAARRVPGTVPLLGAVGLVAAGVLPVLSLCVPVAARERGWSAAATGLVEAAWIVGTLSVTVLVAKRGTGRVRAVVPLTVGPLLTAAGVLGIAASPHPRYAAAAAVVMGLGTAVFTTHLAPLYVRRTPDGMLARFQALLGFVQAAPLLVVTNGYGALTSAGSATYGMLAAAGLTGAAAVLVLSSSALRAS